MLKDEPERGRSGEHGERADEQRQPAARRRPQGKGQAQERCVTHLQKFYTDFFLSSRAQSCLVSRDMYESGLVQILWEFFLYICRRS